jgi:hypothetical protein
LQEKPKKRPLEDVDVWVKWNATKGVGHTRGCRDFSRFFEKNPKKAPYRRRGKELPFFDFEKCFGFLILDILKCPFFKSADSFLQKPWLLTIIENYGVVPEKIIHFFETLNFSQ